MNKGYKQKNTSPMIRRSFISTLNDAVPCSSKPFLFLKLGSFLAIEKLMPCSSIVNKSTGQVCRPAEKSVWKKNYCVNVCLLYCAELGKIELL